MHSLWLFVCLFFLFMLQTSTAEADPSSKNRLFDQDIPIFYGEEYFRERLENLASEREKPLGLLLSGGSARAFAHIGVLKAMDEKGLSPDFIVTNSMGSIVGILYGAGMSPDEILETIQRIDLASLFQPELPLKGGFLDTRKFAELSRELTLANDIRDLPIPVVVVCEDLKSKRTVILAEGDLEEVLAASFALPVYFNPVEFGEHSLIDGGVSNIAPIDLPYRYTDSVIVSTTFYSRELNLNNPLTILNVAMDITKTRAGVKGLKEYGPVWIRCDVESYSFMDWAAVDEIALRGYESARSVLSEASTVDPLESVSASYLSEIRSTSRERLDSGYSEYLRTGTVYYSPAAVGVRIVADLNGGPGYKPLLQSGNRISLGPYLKSGYSELNVNAFYQPEWLNESQPGSADLWGTAVDLQLFPARMISFDIHADLNFSSADQDRHFTAFSSGYGRFELWAPFLPRQHTVAGPFLRTELITDDQFSPQNTVLLGGLRLGFHGNGVRETEFSTETGFFFQNGRSAFQTDSMLRFVLFPWLGLRQRIFSRFSAEISAEVPYYPGDFYRGSAEQEELPGFLIGNSSLAFMVPGLHPTFGETLILDHFSAGPFCDFRFSSDGIEYCTGGFIEASLSMIGLKPLSIHLDYGYNQNEKTVVSFYFGM